MTTRQASLGEVQSLCQKATRGAGRAHGVAEDAGHAVRWLCARGQDGAGALARLLQATDRLAPSDLVPDLPGFSPVGAGICPLMLGGYLSDTGILPEGFVLGPVWEPMLMLPFVWDLSGTGVEILHRGDGCIGLAPLAVLPAETPHDRARICPETLEILEDFAARTYAPATEASRARGAGAGVGDND